MKTYEVRLRYHDRKMGPSGETLKVDASGQCSAIGKAVRLFLAGLDKRNRFDAGKILEVRSVRVGASQ
jgi:hypothetical protein